MGSKNRQGCCCGTREPTCYNVADICRGSAHAVLYVKNGRVEDDNGEWALTPILGLTPADTAWVTDPIKFTTNRWTDGDCKPKNGDAYYHYQVGSGGVYCALMYSIQDCGASTLYTGSKDATGQQYQTKDYAQIDCDPISAEYDFDEIEGLAPPTLKAKILFDVDDEATRSCGCRLCRSAHDYPLFSPLGDIALTYDIDYPGLKKDGSIILKRMDASSDTLHGPDGTLYLGLWKANLDWWDQPSCSNPTNSKDLWNVSYGCNDANFLRWCQPGAPPFTTPYMSPKPGVTRSRLEYDLIDPNATPAKQGSVVFAETDATGFDGVCCHPCILPKKDVAVSAEPIGASTTSYEFTLKYFENTKVSGDSAFQWAVETPISKKYDPLNPNPDPATAGYPFYPGSSPFPPDPGITIGQTYRYNVYLDCENLYWAWIKPDGTDGDLRTWQAVDYAADTQDAFPPYTFDQTDYTCEPFHFVNKKGSGGAGAFPLTGRTLRLDEVE